MRIFRVAIPVRQIDESCAFYESLLGMLVDDTVPSRLYFHCDDVILALIDWSMEERGQFHPTPENVYLATGELDAVFDRAVAAGARVTSPVELRPWGERSLYCVDPDGNQLCFVDDTTLFLGHGADWA